MLLKQLEKRMIATAVGEFLKLHNMGARSSPSCGSHVCVWCRFFYFWLLMFLVHQTSVGIFRLMGAIGRTLVIATTFGSILVLFIVTLSGFVLAYPQVLPGCPSDFLRLF